LVPRCTVSAEHQTEPLAAQPPLGLTAGGIGPVFEPRLNRAEQRRLAVAPVLPREIAIPAPPFGGGGSSRRGLASQRQIRDDQGRQRSGVVTRDPVAVAKGVELLDIAEALAGLAFHPAAQADLQRAVFGFKRP